MTSRVKTKGHSVEYTQIRNEMASRVKTNGIHLRNKMISRVKSKGHSMEYT